tara:strand:- start:714 stop:866 length:153 start_codon:yes stop_codon:yes gene_type:complete
MKLLKCVTIIVETDSQDIWDNTLKDMNDVIKLMTNITRRIKIIKIEEVEK